MASRASCAIWYTTSNRDTEYWQWRLDLLAPWCRITGQKATYRSWQNAKRAAFAVAKRFGLTVGDVRINGVLIE